MNNENGQALVIFVVVLVLGLLVVLPFGEWLGTLNGAHIFTVQ